MSDEEEKGATVAVIGTGADAAKAVLALAGITGPRQSAASDDPIKDPPILAGPHGRAWRVDLGMWRRIMRAGPDGCCAVWIIEAEWAHPVWHSYMISLVHLRPVEGMDAPAIYREGATHEFMLFALDPADRRQRVIRGRAAAAMLMPPNFGAQLVAEHDAAAMELVEKAIADICAGTLSPDTDFRSQWVERFGDTMVRPEFRR